MVRVVVPAQASPEITWPDELMQRGGKKGQIETVTKDSGGLQKSATGVRISAGWPEKLQTLLIPMMATLKS